MADSKTLRTRLSLFVVAILLAGAGLATLAWLHRGTRLTEARTLLTRERPAEAAAAARTVLTYAPFDQEALRILARAHYDQRDWEKSDQVFDRVRSKSPDEMTQAALCAAETGALDKAARMWIEYSQSVEDPDRAFEAYLRKLDSFTSRSDWYFLSQKIMASDDQRFVGLTRLQANMHQRHQQPEQATRLFAKLTKLRPSDPEAKYLAAEESLKAGKAEEVLQAFSSAPGHREQWLVSRALLRLNRMDEFRQKLESAGPESWLAPDQVSRRVEPAVLVGAKRCADCHPKHFATQSTTHHARTIGVVARETDARLSATTEIREKTRPGVTHTLRREGNKTFADVSEAGQPTTTVELLYRLGTNHHGITYLASDAAGQIVEFRMSRYKELGDNWDITTGHEDKSSPAPNGKVIRPFLKMECFRCHNTLLLAPELVAQGGDHELGIRCETCHGPGSNHVAVVKAGLVARDPAIRQPRKLSPEESVAICANCHQNPLSPTTIENPDAARFQTIGIRASLCFKQSEKMTCVTCHPPHAERKMTRVDFDQKCIACHDVFAKLPCPKDKGTASCVDCHMPNVRTSFRNSLFVDHYIRRPNG